MKGQRFILASLAAADVVTAHQRHAKIRKEAMLIQASPHILKHELTLYCL